MFKEKKKNPLLNIIKAQWNIKLKIKIIANYMLKIDKNYSSYQMYNSIYFIYLDCTSGFAKYCRISLAVDG